MDTMTPNAFPITVEATWTEADVIPPRCTKPRDISHDIQHMVTVPMIGAEEFPVALISRNWEGVKEYHFYDGHLYAPYLPNSRQTEMFTAGSESFSAEQRLSGWGHRYRTLDEMHAHIEASYNTLLIVDGKVWTKTTYEPYYEVYASGTTWTSPKRTFLSVTTHSNQAEYTLFNANEREEAIAYAMAITPEEKRAETLKRFESEEATIEVLIPAAVKQAFNRTRAKGESIVSEYAYKVQRDFELAMEHKDEFVDPEAVGRGEISYRDYLEAALKHLSEVEEPRQRALEAERGW